MRPSDFHSTSFSRPFFSFFSISMHIFQVNSKNSSATLNPIIMDDKICPQIQSQVQFINTQIEPKKKDKDFVLDIGQISIYAYLLFTPVCDFFHTNNYLGKTHYQFKLMTLFLTSEEWRPTQQPSMICLNRIKLKWDKQNMSPYYSNQSTTILCEASEYQDKGQQGSHNPSKKWIPSIWTNSLGQLGFQFGGTHHLEKEKNEKKSAVILYAHFIWKVIKSPGQSCEFRIEHYRFLNNLDLDKSFCSSRDSHACEIIECNQEDSLRSEIISITMKEDSPIPKSYQNLMKINVYLKEYQKYMKQKEIPSTRVIADNNWELKTYKYADSKQEESYNQSSTYTFRFIIPIFIVFIGFFAKCASLSFEGNELGTLGTDAESGTRGTNGREIPPIALSESNERPCLIIQQNELILTAVENRTEIRSNPEQPPSYESTFADLQNSSEDTFPPSYNEAIGLVK